MMMQMASKLQIVIMLILSLAAAGAFGWTLREVTWGIKDIKKEISKEHENIYTSQIVTSLKGDSQDD